MKIKNILLIVAISLILATCKENPTEPGSSSDFIVSPKILSLTNKVPGYIWLSLNEPKPFNWIITKHPDWLDVSEEAGSSSGQPEKIIFSGNLDPVKSQTLEGVVEITVPGHGVYNLTVILALNDNPHCSVSPSELSLSSYDNSEVFQIKNDGGGLLEWRIESNHPGLSYSLDSGSLKYNQSASVSVYLNKLKFKPGSYVENARIISNSDTLEITLRISISVIEDFRFPRDIQITNFTNDTTLYFSNYGNNDVKWEITDIPNYVTINPGNGVIPGGDSVKIELSVLRNQLETGTYTSQMNISYNNDNSNISLSVSHFKEEKTFLNYDIVDAQFLRSSDLIVFAVKNTNRILLVDLNGNVVNTINLTYIPLCLSNISNNRIVVAHSGKISVINLSTLSVENIFSISCDPVSIILAPNNWVYASPQEDQWESIRCVDLSTGKENPNSNWDLYAGSKFILHTSGNYIYSITMGLSPQDMEKFDISEGPVKSMYDSPYHGDFAMGSYFWMSEDGIRIFTSSGNVFKSDEVKSDDMIYNGNMGFSSLHSLNQNSDKNIIGIAYNTVKNYDPDKTYMSIIDNNTYNEIKIFKVPSYYLYDPNNSKKYIIKESFCRYLFISSDGNKVFLVLNPFSDEYYGSVPKTNWAYVIMNIN
ncbi:MAG: hypothetical protein A2X61_10140 [Ignavibacteria bacterium GWB2_35_12]|nr:MAG: hypothetical protein A2X63_06425 [Ignavibacteria bacterium GWA2_35_8]OGU39707.1 MAG: hypothetical protein A2X61_10140 [Ignavibacteria bacterium GWB2_35_12]OGU93162.1 MAG: hypothetical protein A2220_09205 [Ignavibacteria bacterium RIFOXYA2_FULL_35_10]OGV23902.1 MAG: hypothetical protein A2475_07330 [Ignavibacteria bacterium RIFOXYC2_FULL_35_21]